tara:strand:+ start:945 stop:1091 length:147 start_codon:yes stop_codon:yes gene_type:complete
MTKVKTSETPLSSIKHYLPLFYLCPNKGKIQIVLEKKKPSNFNKIRGL